MTDPSYDTGPNPYPKNPLQDPDQFGLGDTDPLLEAGWFIDVDQETEEAEPATGLMTEPEEKAETTATPVPGAATPLDVTPVSQRRPKRQVDETSERPSWLPDGWKMEVRVRTSGATAGVADRYFTAPSGQRFRSKVEVLHYLETGSKRRKAKIKSDSDAAMPSESPSEERKKKSKSYTRDFSDLNFDFKNPPESVTWVQADDCPDEWVASTGNTTVTAHNKTEWVTVFGRVTQLR